MSKTRVTYTIDEVVSKKFNEVAAASCINKSAMIELIIVDFINRELVSNEVKYNDEKEWFDWYEAKFKRKIINVKKVD